MNIWIMFLIIVLFYVIGVPIAYSMGIGAIIFLAANGIAPEAMAQKLLNGVDVTSLLCVPFFLLTGILMSRGGIGDKLIYLSKMLVGRLRGGLCYVSILACTFFAAITGTTSACISSIGPIVIPAMEEEGYNRDFATSICLAGSTLGPIVPPSLSFIVYASISGASIRKLYLVGIPTGVLIAIGFCLYIYIRSRREGFAASPLEKWKNLDDEGKKSRKKMLIGSLWALGAPIVILGGIFGGICTPTEAAVIAAVYSLVVSLCVFKQIKIRDLPKIFMESARSTARIMFIIACATLFGFVLVYEQIPQHVMAAFSSVTTSKYILLLIMVVILFIMGMFMETTSIMLIAVPIFLPLMQKFGLDLIHVGAFMAALLSIGAITPPYGSLLFIGTFIGDVPLQRLFKRIIPFIGVMLVVTLLIVFIPDLVMWIV